MLLEGSCHCGSVKFRVESKEPYPYQRCYCSICRKTAGGGGFAINLGADANTLEIEGSENLTVYHAKMYDREDPDGRVPASEAERNFCKFCGSALWLFSPNWPDLVHPHASAIDTPLPKPPEHVRILLDSAASWVEIPEGEREKNYDHFPEESLKEWHKRHGIYG